MSDKFLKELLLKRLKLRKEKKYKEADEIRKDLEAIGFIVEDTKNCSCGYWRR